MYNQHEMMTGIVYIQQEQLLLFTYIQYVRKQQKFFPMYIHNTRHHPMPIVHTVF